MKLTFKGNFKEEINELGNSVLLQYLKLDDSEDLIEFESLWYEENKTLNMTLDLSNLKLPESKVISSITVMYSDLSYNIIGEAFTLTDTEELNLCNAKRDSGMTRDLNHITVYFPKTAVANIETIIVNENAAFLESTAGLVGVNTFLAVEGEYEDEDYLTKNSYKTYLRNQISLKNTKPLYLDRKGEKVTNISTYKHYKKVEIEATDAISQVITGDKKRYSVSNGGTVMITGTCYYDLYNVNNGVYTLVTANLISDLTATVLVQVDVETGIVMDAVSEACTIDQSEKSITFNSEKDTETNDFAAILSFMPEIDDAELGYTRGKRASIKSNVLEFLTYLRWNVEYSSSLLHDDGNVVMLFDYPANSGIWNYDEGREERSSTITLYSESKLNVENDIKITPYDDPDSEEGRIMREYFTIEAPVERGQDSSDKRWIYDITITTKLENSGDSLWYPLTTNSEGTSSKLILNTIKILGSTRNATSNVNFYCVQRPNYPLVPVTLTTQSGWQGITGNEIMFPDSIGIKDFKDIYISKPVEGYTRWEAEYRDLDADVVIRATSPDVVDADYSETASSSSSITALTRVPFSYEKLNLGYIKFHRRNNQGAADFTNWRDLIYCHPCNSTQLNFTVQAKELDTTWAILPDPLRQNYPDLKGTPTKYYYENTDGSYRLYLFEERESKSFRLQHQGATFSSSWITYENQETWEKYFRLSASSESNSTTITITSKARQDNDSTEAWYPKNVSSNPLWVKITNGTKSETFYCILKPQLGSLGLYVRNENNTYDSISEYEFVEDDRITDGGVIKHRKVVYVDSPIISSEFSHWTVLSKDSEIKVQTTDPTANISYNNSGTVLSSNTGAWSANPVYTILETSSLPYNSADIKFEDLVLCRTSNSSYFTSLADLMEDWKNQLCEDSQLILPMSLKNPVSSDSLQVYTLKKNTTDLEQIGTESNPYLELDWIGLYRIFVKSENGFRVRLDSTNSSDGFYFFDPSFNEIKKDVLTMDEGSFDSVNGREICFAFIGNEENSFDVLEQTLKTSIHITNFADGSTIVIPLYRKYFNRQATTGTLSSQVLDTNIKLSQSLDNRIFIQNSDSGEFNIKYSSNLETVLKFTDYRENTEGLNINIPNPYGEHTFKYNQYLSQGDYKRNGRTVTFGTRGYIGSSSSLSYHAYSVENEDLNYPISPVGSISITNPGQLYNQNQERIETTLYRLNPCPSISTDYDGTLMEVRLPYKSGKSAIVHVNAENGFYNLYYKIGNNGEYTKVNINSNGFGSATIGNQVTIERLNTNNDDPLLGLGWKITTLSDYTEDEVNNLAFGGLKFETYVPKDNFLKDKNGNLDTTTYSQDDVNRLVSPAFKTLTLVRLSKKNSNNTIEGGSPEILISRKGETRSNFILNKVDSESEVSTNEYSSEWSGYINSITYSPDAQTFSVSYKNRLQRAGLNSSGASLGYISYTNGKITAGNTLGRMIDLSGENLDSNFSIKVGDAKVTSEGISQETWDYGIMIDGTVYVGTYSTSLDSFSYEGGSAQHYICQVKLAKTANSNIEVIDNLLELVVDSIQPTVGGQVINNVVSNPSNTAARWSGRTYTVAYPENNDTYSHNYRYTIKDDYGNSVSILGSVGVRDQFEVGLYSSYDSTNNTVSESDRLSYVLFSAGGKQMSTVYLLTDYGVNGEYGQTPYLSSSTSSYSNPIRDESGASLIGGNSSYYGSYSVNERVTVSSSPIRVTKDGKEYMLYSIVMTSKVSSVTYQSSFNTVASVPHKRDITLHINYSSYATVTAYYGVCYLQLKKPAPSFVSVGENSVVYYYEFRSDEDSGELEKYTRSGSYLVSNTRPRTQSGSSYSFNIENKLLVSYSELGSETAKYGDNFSTLGYYSGWMIEVIRKEWTASGNNVSPSPVQLNSTYTLTAEGACDIDTGMNQELQLPDGELVWVSEYDRSGNATCYNGNSEVGIIFELPASRFNNKSGQNYELKSAIPITVGYPDTSWDNLTFYVDMILDFTR